MWLRWRATTIRRDRKESEHGGVCVYIKDTIKFTVLDDLEDPSFEALWIQISPTLLSKGYSYILLGAFYHPPSANDSEVFVIYRNTVFQMWPLFSGRLKQATNHTA